MNDLYAQIQSAANAGATGLNGYAMPTPAQLQSGNYRKGRVRLYGLDIAIETPQGQPRLGKSDGKPWSVICMAHYGDISGTRGADGDPVDCYVGPSPESNRVFVVNQNGKDGAFDEHKVMLAFADEDAARAAYMGSYERGWTGLGSMVSATVEQFLWWLKFGNTTKPFSKNALPYDGDDDMTDITWDSAGMPANSDLATILYGLRLGDREDGLLLDAVQMSDILEDADSLDILDALVVENAKLGMKMEQLRRIMDAAGETVKPISMQVSEPFKQKGTTNVTALFELSDGQTVAIFFHNPDSTPNKILPQDELVSWKWLLNKKDVTILVAPEKGRDLNPREVARRIMRLAEKNSAKFQKANGARAERLAAIEQAKGAVAEKESTLASLDAEIADLTAKVEAKRANQAPDPAAPLGVSATELATGAGGVEPESIAAIARRLIPAEFKTVNNEPDDFSAVADDGYGIRVQRTSSGKSTAAYILLPGGKGQDAMGAKAIPPSGPEGAISVSVDVAVSSIARRRAAAPAVASTESAPREQVSTEASNPNGLSDAQMVVLISALGWKSAFRLSNAMDATGISEAQYTAARDELNAGGRYLKRSAITPAGENLINAFMPETRFASAKINAFKGRFANAAPDLTKAELVEGPELSALGMANIVSLGSENLYIEKGGQVYYTKDVDPDNYQLGPFNFFDITPDVLFSPEQIISADDRMLKDRRQSLGAYIQAANAANASVSDPILDEYQAIVSEEGRRARGEALPDARPDRGYPADVEPALDEIVQNYALTTIEFNGAPITREVAEGVFKKVFAEKSDEDARSSVNTTLQASREKAKEALFIKFAELYREQHPSAKYLNGQAQAVVVAKGGAVDLSAQSWAGDFYRLFKIDPSKINRPAVEGLSPAAAANLARFSAGDFSHSGENTAEAAAAYTEAARAFLESDLTAPFPKKKDDTLDLEFLENVQLKPIDKAIKVAKTAKQKIDVGYDTAASNDVRYYLNGIHVDFENKLIVSTDGHRMMVIEDVDLSVLPPRTEDEISRGLTVLNRDGQWIEGKFPDWRRVMPATAPGTPEKFTAKRVAAQARAVTRASRYASRTGFNPMKIIIGDRSTHVAANYVMDMAVAFAKSGAPVFRMVVQPGQSVHSGVFAESLDGKIRQVIMPVRVNNDVPAFAGLYPDGQEPEKVAPAAPAAAAAPEPAPAQSRADWQTAVTEALADSLEIPYSDADGVLDVHTGLLDEQYSKGAAPEDVAKMIEGMELSSGEPADPHEAVSAELEALGFKRVQPNDWASPAFDQENGGTKGFNVRASGEPARYRLSFRVTFPGITGASQDVGTYETVTELMQVVARELDSAGAAPAADQSQAARELLQSVIDGTADLDEGLTERLEAVHDQFQGDAEIMALFEQAANAFSDAMVAKAKAALA